MFWKLWITRILLRELKALVSEIETPLQVRNFYRNPGERNEVCGYGGSMSLNIEMTITTRNHWEFRTLRFLVRDTNQFSFGATHYLFNAFDWCWGQKNEPCIFAEKWLSKSSKIIFKLVLSALPEREVQICWSR